MNKAQDIIAAVARVHGVSSAELHRNKHGHRHPRLESEARFTAFALLHRAGWGVNAIATMFNRNHSSVSKGIERFNEIVSVDEEYRRRSQAVEMAVVKK